jgi:hypothetical protein
MSNDSIHIYDHKTGETLVREMTSDEQVARNLEVAEAIAVKAAKLAEKEALKVAKLNAIEKLKALGIDPKALGLQVEDLTEIVSSD